MKQTLSASLRIAPASASLARDVSAPARANVCERCDTALRAFHSVPAGIVTAIVVDTGDSLGAGVRDRQQRRGVVGDRE